MMAKILEDLYYFSPGFLLNSIMGRNKDSEEEESVYD
jgi:hypothetical protein